MNASSLSEFEWFYELFFVRTRCNIPSGTQYFIGEETHASFC